MSIPREAYSETILDDEEVQSYLRQATRSWLGLPTACAVDPPAVPRHLAARLLRVEEYTQSHRDQWGCWEFSFCASYWAGTLWRAELDRWAAAKRAELAPTTSLEPLWPDGRPFAVCLSHDVDMVSRRAAPRQVLRSVRGALNDHAGNRGSPPEVAENLARTAGRIARYGVSRSPSIDDTLGKAMALEHHYGVPASYFFALHSRSRNPVDCTYGASDVCLANGRRQTIADVIRMVRGSGFDVGLHGSYGSALDAHTMQAEKRELELILGEPVVSARQHYLHLDLPRTPAIQEQVGLRADSTLGFNRNVGFRAGTSLPFRMFDLRERRSFDVLEIPLIVQEAPLVSPVGLELDVERCLGLLTLLLDEIAEVNGVFTVLMHPHSLEHPDNVLLFREVIESGLQRRAWFASAADIDRWWREREARIFGTANALAPAA